MLDFPHEKDPCCRAPGPGFRCSGVRRNYPASPSPSPPSQGLGSPHSVRFGMATGYVGKLERSALMRSGPSACSGIRRSIPHPSRFPITSFGPVTSGTFPRLNTVLHSCHEENCCCRAVSGRVCRSGPGRLAFSQKAPQGSTGGRASQGPARDESEP